MLSDGELDPKYVRQRNQSLSCGHSFPPPPSLLPHPIHQPHLARTRLCELSDGELDPKYVRQRNQLRQLVASLVQPKIVSGRPVTGEEFADLLEKVSVSLAGKVHLRGVATALTGEEGAELLEKMRLPSHTTQAAEAAGGAAGEDETPITHKQQLRQLVALLVQPKIVSGRPVTGGGFCSSPGKTGSVVDAFNRAVQDKCLALYHDTMKRLLPFLPAEEAVLLAAHRNASGDALGAFERERFGGKSVEDAVRPLKDELREVSMCGCVCASVPTCGRGVWEVALVAVFERERFGGKSVEDAVRPLKDELRERSQFLKEYNQRLFNWLVIGSLVLVVVGRFMVKWVVVEVLAWALFVFLEISLLIYTLHPPPQNPCPVPPPSLPLTDMDSRAVPISQGVQSASLQLAGHRLARACRRRPFHGEVGGRGGACVGALCVPGDLHADLLVL
ncbi:unnamed protein product [Closterium sp. NIES-53]